MKTANSSKLGKQHLPLHTAATGWERAGTSGEHWQDIPHQPTQRCSCCHCGDKKGQRRNGSTVRNSAEILWRQENSKALELRAVFFFEATGLMAAHTALHQGCDNCRNTECSLRGSSWMKTSCVSSTNFFFFKATFLKILLNHEFWGKTSLPAPEGSTLHTPLAQCYQGQKATEKNLLSPHSLKLCRADVHDANCLKNFLFFFLKMYICGCFRTRFLCAVQL